MHNSTVHSSTVHSGTVHSGTVHNGTAHSGTVHTKCAVDETNKKNGVTDLKLNEKLQMIRREN